MHKQGAILLGTGGDNGNGSSGTFYEGVMTTGYPADATTDAVQANIVAARYDVPRVTLSRVTTFTPGATQESPRRSRTRAGGGGRRDVADFRAGRLVRDGRGPGGTSVTFPTAVAAGASVSAAFTVTSPAATGAGILTSRAEWTTRRRRKGSETTTARVRNVFPIKINEVRFNAGNNATDQFVELYNASTVRSICPTGRS